MRTQDIQIKEFEFSDSEYKHIRDIITFAHKNTKNDEIKKFAYCMFYNVYEKSVGRGRVLWFKPEDLNLFLLILKETAENPSAPSFAKDFEKNVLEALK